MQAQNTTSIARKLFIGIVSFTDDRMSQHKADIKSEGDSNGKIIPSASTRRRHISSELTIYSEATSHPHTIFGGKNIVLIIQESLRSD